jgi:hypothetical protein
VRQSVWKRGMPASIQIGHIFRTGRDERPFGAGASRDHAWQTLVSAKRKGIQLRASALSKLYCIIALISAVAFT